MTPATKKPATKTAAKSSPSSSVAAKPKDTPAKAESSSEPAKDSGRLVVPPAPAQPNVIHNVTRRSDADALTGHAVEVTHGEHKGLRGVFERVDEWEKDGYPKQIIVSLHNVTGFLLSLPYKHVRHLPPGTP